MKNALLKALYAGIAYTVVKLIEAATGMKLPEGLAEGGALMVTTGAVAASKRAVVKK